MTFTEERSGVGTVEGPVVPAHRQVADRVDGDGLAAVGSSAHDRPALDAVGREDRDLRLVDDRHVSNVPAGPGFVIVNVPPRISSGDSFRDRARAARSWISRAMARSRFAVGVADHRYEQALEVEVDRDAEIDVAVHDQLVVADARVQLREVGEGVEERRATNGR